MPLNRIRLAILCLLSGHLLGCLLIGGIGMPMVAVLAPFTAHAGDTPATSPPQSDDSQAALRQQDQADALKAEQLRIASRLTDDFPKAFDAFRVMGYVHSSQGNLDEMFACWQRCLALAPGRADVYIQLGRYALQAEKYDDAIDYWQQARKIDPQTPFVLQNIGNALLNLGRTEDAIRILEQEVEIAPLASETHFLLGEAYFQLRDFTQAKRRYQRAVELEPNHTKAVYGLVKVCARLGQREEAATYSAEFQRLEDATAQSDQEYRSQYDDLQQMKQRLADTCTEAGQVYYRHANVRQAERLWLRAAEVDPQNAACRTLLASWYTQERKAADALRQYQELLRIEPDHVDHFQKIGFLQARLGNFAAAESAFRKMVEVAPRDAAGHRALAKFYLNTNRQTALAQKLADKAVQLEPVADSYFVQGWANAKNGKPQQALVALQKAIRLNPENATYRKLYEAVQGKETKSSP